MTTVWIVYCNQQYEGSYVEAVCATQESADKEVERLDKEHKYCYKNHTREAVEVKP